MAEIKLKKIDVDNPYCKPDQSIVKKHINMFNKGVFGLERNAADRFNMNKSVGKLDIKKLTGKTNRLMDLSNRGHMVNKSTGI